MILVNYKDKYIKYKNKYLEIKNIIQKGGMDCINDRVFKNILGTCWMVSIQMMFCFGDATKDDIECKLIIIKNDIEDNIEKLIESKRCELESFFPPDYLQIANRDEYLYNLISAFVKRFWAKLGEHTTMKVKDINDKENPLRCERIINYNFKKLFSYYKPDIVSGDTIEQFYFANILGIFLLNQKIYAANYTRQNFNSINFDPSQDIGIIIHMELHTCCSFVCEGEYKFYNDSEDEYYKCEWINLLGQLNQDEDLFVVPKGIVKLDINEYFQNIENYSDYKRIQFLTIISKRELSKNFDKQTYNFFNNNENEIDDFYLLYKIGIKYYYNGDYEKALQFYINSAKFDFCEAHYLIGEAYYYGTVFPKNIDEAIAFYKIAFNKGSIDAAYKLGEIHKINNDYDNAIKYFKVVLYNDPKKNITYIELGDIYLKIGHYKEASLYFKFCFKHGSLEEKKDAAVYLSHIYYHNYKYYREAIDYKMIYVDEENKCKILDELDQLKDFTKLKKLADEGFIDLQFEVGEKYINENNIFEGICYIELAAEQDYKKASKFLLDYYLDKAHYYLDKEQNDKAQYNLDKAKYYLDKSA